MRAVIAVAALILAACDGTETASRSAGGDFSRPPGCGDTIVQGIEECDGPNFGWTCESLGFTGGTLACSYLCTVRTTGCTGPSPCGDGLIDPFEQCDGANFFGESCLTLGYTGGTLLCSSECLRDTSSCTGVDPCGNGFRNNGEYCDGADLGARSCLSWGYGDGTLACNDDCTFDFSACAYCGDRQLGDDEQCDGDQLGGATCASFGFADGGLDCNGDCTYDTSYCTGSTCGNGALDPGEDCDRGNLFGGSCTDLGRGFDGGTLACHDAFCSYDMSGCTRSTVGCIYDQDLGSAVGSVTGTTTGENDTYTPDCAGFGGNDHVYRWTAPSTGSWQFDTGGSAFDTVLSILDANCAVLGCFDNFGTNTIWESFMVYLSTGQVIYIVVDGAADSDAGSFLLRIMSASPGEAACSNWDDDDADGLYDCDDPTDCKSFGVCTPGAAAVGDPCTANTDCAANTGDPACLDDALWGLPGGYCSEWCSLSALDCPAGAVCVDFTVEHGLCVQLCTSDTECRQSEGFACLDPSGMGQTVCWAG